MKLNRTELANFLDVAETTIDRWIAREGLPVLDRPGQGKEMQFDSGDVVRWLTAREAEKAASRADADDLDQLRARKIEVETQIKQLQLCRESGAVAPVEQMGRAVTKAFVELRQNLRQLPQRLEPQLIGETDPVRFKAVALAEIDQALNTLADADLFGDDEEFGGLTDE